jgi:hypothetical protein
MARKYDDDDGRTIADMSALERPSLMGLRQRQREEKPAEGKELNLDRSERRAMIRGAVSAGLLVAAVFALCFALLILLLQLVWR